MNQPHDISALAEDVVIKNHPLYPVFMAAIRQVEGQPIGEQK